MAAGRPCALSGRMSRRCAGTTAFLLLQAVVFAVATANSETTPTTAIPTTTLPPCDVDGVASHDVTLRSGSPFEMTCTLTVWPPKQHFQLTVLRSREHPVPASELRHNNATSVTWSRDHVKDADAATYYCSVKGDNCESVFNATALTVGHIPKQPDPPTCFGDRFETFTCSWQMPDNGVETTYEVLLRVGPNHVFSLIPCNKSSGAHPQSLVCQLNTSGKMIYRIEERVLMFEVKGSNMFGVEEWVYAVNHFANVELAPPKVVNCNAKVWNASVNWTGLPDISTFPDVLYEVRLKHESGEDVKLSVKNSEETSVEKLTPNTRYDVSVRVKFSMARNELWSPFSKPQHCKTSKTRPTVLPNVTENSFIIQDLGDRRMVRLFYKRVPKFLWNGDHMSYVLHWCSTSGECATHRVSGERSYLDLFNLSRVESYTFHLFSENELGRSLKSVRVIVPSADLVLPPLQDAYISEVHASEPRFSLAKWDQENPAVVGKVHHYTFFWCRKSSKDMESCDGDVSWASVKSVGDAWNAVGCAFAGNCKYGVATRSAEAVSPMAWIDCVVPHSKEYQGLYHGQDGVHYDEITDTTVRLAFLTKCSGLVASRLIHFCVIDDRGEQQTNETSTSPVGPDATDCLLHKAGPEKVVSMDKLNPATTYEVSITTVLEDGTRVPHRKLILKTQSRASYILATTFIVVAVVLVVLVAVGLFFWRRISSYVEVYKNTTVKVLIPADFAKEPLKKTESVRSNLREYVLGSKNYSYGLPQITAVQGEEAVDSLQYPELDRLLSGSPSDSTNIDIPYSSFALSTSLPENKPPPGYFPLSTSQGEPMQAEMDSAYSKFSTSQSPPEETPAPPLANPYSRLSSLFLSGLESSGKTGAVVTPQQSCYSKFTAVGNRTGSDVANECDCEEAQDDTKEKAMQRSVPAAPYVQVTSDATHQSNEQKEPIQPYTKLSSTLQLYHSPSVLRPPQGMWNHTGGYTSLPSLLTMCNSPQSAKTPAPLSDDRRSSGVGSALKNSSVDQSKPYQPYQLFGVDSDGCSRRDEPPGTLEPVSPYTTVNIDAAGGVEVAPQEIDRAPPYVQAACEPPAPVHGASSFAKTQVPLEGYSKVATRVEPGENHREGISGDVLRKCSTLPELSVFLPENDSLDSPPSCAETSSRDDCDTDAEADLLSVEYSGSAKEQSDGKPVFCTGGYTSWDVLAKPKECGVGSYARAVGNT